MESIFVIAVPLVMIFTCIAILHLIPLKLGVLNAFTYERITDNGSETIAIIELLIIISIIVMAIGYMNPWLLMLAALVQLIHYGIILHKFMELHATEV